MVIMKAHVRRRLTQVKVILKAIAESHNAENSVPDCCESTYQQPGTVGMGIYGSMEYRRAADGFFPKYLCWYLSRSPRGLISGMGPLGSRS
jgi:hypothetical protein